MKRKAGASDELASSTPKKPAIAPDRPEFAHSLDPLDPSSAGDNSDGDDDDDDDDDSEDDVENDNDEDDEDDDTSTVHPTSGTQTDAATTITTTSRASRKFPSDEKKFNCTYPDCTKTFNRPARLASHLRSHVDERPFPCDVPGCSKAYRDKKHLIQHTKDSHLDKRDYKCAVPNCGKSFATSTRLKRHVVTHEKAARFQCKGHADCTKTFRHRKTLERHIRIAHLKQAAYPCTHSDCTEGFNAHSALRRHIQKAHGTCIYWCDICKDEGAGFTNLPALQVHMRKNHVPCPFCDFNGIQTDVERHIATQHPISSQPSAQVPRVPCPQCPKTYTRVSNLNAHIKTVHERVRFVCGQVDTSEVDGIQDWNWQEEGCGTEFRSKVKLQEHVKFVHLGQKRPPKQYPVPTEDPRANVMDTVKPRDIPCTQADCTATFLRHADMEKHVRRHHAEPQPAAASAAAGAEAVDPLLLGAGETGAMQQDFQSASKDWAQLSMLLPETYEQAAL